MFIRYPSEAFVDSFWSRVKPEQSNVACLHLLYQEEQVLVCRGCPDLSGREASWNPEGECWLFSFKRMLKLSPLPCKAANDLHTNHPQESGGLGKRSDHYHTNLISDQLRQSPCSICPATQAWGSIPIHRSLKTASSSRWAFQICISTSLLKIILFIYFVWAGTSLLLGLFSGCSEQKLLSGCSAWLLIVVPSLFTEQRLSGCRLSSWGAWALQHRLNSCCAQAWLLCTTWDPPRSGNEPVSPALSGGFFTTETPGKPCTSTPVCSVHMWEYSTDLKDDMVEEFLSLTVQY